MNAAMLHNLLPALKGPEGKFDLNLIDDPRHQAEIKKLVPYAKTTTTLAALNDHGAPFSFIADIIEHLATPKKEKKS